MSTHVNLHPEFEENLSEVEDTQIIFRLGWPVFWAEDIAYKEVPETRKSLGPSGTERKSMLLKDGKQKQQTSNQGGGQGPGYSEPCEKWEVWIFYLVLWETTEWFKVEERQVTLAALGKAE